jgi:hypothetical protein
MIGQIGWTVNLTLPKNNTRASSPIILHLQSRSTRQVAQDSLRIVIISVLVCHASLASHGASYRLHAAPNPRRRSEAMPESRFMRSRNLVHDAETTVRQLAFAEELQWPQ